MQDKTKDMVNATVWTIIVTAFLMVLGLLPFV